MVLLSLIAQNWPTFTSIVTKNTATSLLFSLIPCRTHIVSHSQCVLGLWWDGLADASQWAAPCQCGVNTCESSSVSHNPMCQVPWELTDPPFTFLNLPSSTARHLSQHIQSSGKNILCSFTVGVLNLDYLEVVVIIIILMIRIIIILILFLWIGLQLNLFDQIR